MAVGQPKVRGTGMAAKAGVRMLLDSATGTLMLEAGDGRLKLPGSENEIRVHEGGLWYFVAGKPVGELGMGLVDGTHIPDGDKPLQPVCWDSQGERWVPTQQIACRNMAATSIKVDVLGIGTVVLDHQGITFVDDQQQIPWDSLRVLGDWNPQRPHGLPLYVDQAEGGRLVSDLPIEASNLALFATKAELTAVHKKIAELTPDVTVPVAGRIGFDVDKGKLAITVRKGTKTYRARVQLKEI